GLGQRRKPSQGTRRTTLGLVRCPGHRPRAPSRRYGTRRCPRGGSLVSARDATSIKSLAPRLRSLTNDSPPASDAGVFCSSQPRPPLCTSQALRRRACTLLVACGLVACMLSPASADAIAIGAASPRSRAWRLGGATVFVLSAVAAAAWLLRDARKLHARSSGARPSVASAPW